MTTTSRLHEKNVNEKEPALLYQDYCKPLVAKLMKSLEINVAYTSGNGNILQCELGQILDLTGGYGANIFGHRNREVIDHAKNLLENSINHTQGSIRQEAGKLAELLSSTLKNETSEGPWISHFSNTGTEAVEAAIKFAYLSYFESQEKMRQEILKEMQEALLTVKNYNEDKKSITLQELKLKLMTQLDFLSISDERKSWFLHQLQSSYSLEDLFDLIQQFNQNQLNAKPWLIALENAFHGKTLGSLKVTYNPQYSQKFYTNSDEDKVEFISRNTTNEELSSKLDKSIEFLSLVFINGKINPFRRTKSQIAAIIVEPIQGEAGIHELHPTFLTLIKKHSIEKNILLIFDEIQSGFYRTGTLSAASHHHVSADIYCFSKSMGAGVAKIAATVINRAKYLEEFGMLHTSTFAEDDYSCGIAFHALQLLQDSTELNQAISLSNQLKNDLLELQMQFPNFIKEIRGKGLMLAIEFGEEVKNTSFEYQMFFGSGVLGYAISSALLHKEHLRLSPSLSNPLTLRIQPSMKFNFIEMQNLLRGLKNLLVAFKTKDLYYLLTPALRICNPAISEHKDAPVVKSSRKLAVFFCHIIDNGHYKKMSPYVTSSDLELDQKFPLMTKSSRFSFTHVQELTNMSGETIDIALMSIPLRSHDLKRMYLSKDRTYLVDLLQDAIDHAKECGATTIGLGQFTSIVSHNGLYLDSRGLNITTGNAYTLSSAISALNLILDSKNKMLCEQTIGIVGACGNIMSVASQILGVDAKKVILFHHTAIEKSSKFLQTTKELLQYLESHSQRWKKILSHIDLQSDVEILLALTNQTLSKFIEVESNMERLIECDAIMAGTNSNTKIFTETNLKSNVSIVDVSVPSLLNEAERNLLNQKRPDVTYTLGGIIKIPNNQSIKTCLFPLNRGESYACMAETFAIGFSDEKHLAHLGELTADMVLKAQSLADQAGFIVQNLKTSKSL